MGNQDSEIPEQSASPDVDWPMVSVIVGCYNHERYVEECLDGVLAQDYPRLQWIIFDDCSKDRSADLIGKWLEAHRVNAEFIRHNRNMGLCESLNEAITHVRGKYVAMIAADDVWLPGKSKTEVRMLEALPADVGVAYGDAYRIDLDGQMMPQRFMETTCVQGRPEGEITEALLLGNFIPAMSTMIRRECFETVGLYDKTLYVEDWDMWLRISAHYKFVYSGGPMAKYRWLMTSMSRANQAKLSKGLHDTLAKHILSGQLRESEIIIAKRTLPRYAMELYEMGVPERFQVLWQAWRLTGKKAVLGMYFCARLGMSWQYWNSIKQAMAHASG